MASIGRLGVVSFEVFATFRTGSVGIGVVPQALSALSGWYRS